MAPDEASATLAEARRIADALQFACRLPDKVPDFFACGGPAAEAYWSYFTPARILSFLAAIEARDAALERHMHTFTDSHGTELCGGCLEPVPCPDTDVIGRALAGKDSSDGG